ncbi:hypothetical protein CAMRE0001_3269 [Campylobacter rectus RM3267]|uniref:Uncharacterized protein n=1 Tax=Campylobacter rectus RM3267 TaxID=553218 RepID=B9D5M0_CAMRE|nr:hypothetical protein CAMRE0001_3269 [Campylobacter rectus RM3267]
MNLPINLAWMKSYFGVERFDCVNFMLLPVFTRAYDLNLDFSRPLH